MEFKSLRNIETTLKKIRFFALIFSLLCFGVVTVVIITSYRFANQQREKIYVLDQGKSLMLALSQDERTNRPIEAREHVRRFHKLFFTLVPDHRAIEDNILRALDLADKSAYEYYSDLSEQKYYNRIITSGAIQSIQIDSIVSNFNVYPYHIVTYAKQYIDRKSNKTTRSLVTECYLNNSVRSESNPQGFIIRDFRVVQNKDISKEDKIIKTYE